MAAPRVLVVAGTHGNERNAPWLIQQWRQRPELLQRHGLEVELEIGNPAAVAAQRRYIERDLNRTFVPELLADPSQQGVEAQRARQLLERFGSGGPAACQVALDLHSTTAAMGNSLVVDGRRPADLAARVGGEEFCVLLPETDLAGACSVAEKIGQTMRELGVPHEGSPLGVVTCSIGVSVGYPREGGSPEALIEGADAALYQSKRLGRARVTLQPQGPLRQQA